MSSSRRGRGLLDPRDVRSARELEQVRRARGSGRYGTGML